MKVPDKIYKGMANKSKLWKRMAVIKRDGLKCKVCGTTDTDILTTDHIIARKDGGMDQPRNMQILCRNCHDWKHRND